MDRMRLKPVLYNINGIFPPQFLDYFHALLLLRKISMGSEVFCADFLPLNAKIDFLLNCSFVSRHKEPKNCLVKITKAKGNSEQIKRTTNLIRISRSLYK